MIFQGLGNDIIEVDRIENSIKRYGKKFLDRLFLPEEQAYCLKHKDSERHFAGRFAAKEAVAKALGTGFGPSLSWHDIEIVNDGMGRPIVHLSAQASSYYQHPILHISISHCKKFASAVAVHLASK